MANICRGLQNFFFSPVLKSPTHIVFIGVKKNGSKISHLGTFKLTIPGFPCNLLPLSCGDIGFKKSSRCSIGLEIRPKSAFIAIRLPLPSATILLSDLVRCNSPSAECISIWCTFLNLKLAKNPFLSAMGCHRKSKFKKVHKTVFTICRRLSHLTGWAALLSWRFFKGGETFWGYKYPFIIDK